MRNLGPDWYRRPETIFAEVIRETAINRKIQNFRRAVVVAVDEIGGLLQNPDAFGGVDVINRDGSQTTFRALPGPRNPRGSVKARILTDGFDRILNDDELRVFWPFFSNDQINTSISPGEHVYVVFEDDSLNHGLWMTRVSGQDSANSFEGADSYTFPSRPPSAMDSFEQNNPEYQTDDRSAGLAPPNSSMRFF